MCTGKEIEFARGSRKQVVHSFLLLSGHLPDSYDMYRDMRISNIMEHRTDAEPYLPGGFSSGKKTFQLAGLQIDHTLVHSYVQLMPLPEHISMASQGTNSPRG